VGRKSDEKGNLHAKVQKEQLQKYKISLK